MAIDALESAGSHFKAAPFYPYCFTVEQCISHFSPR
jgi:3-hydroxymyristoyl/3-hydroxydecanoyl-(acyl carrier protein) dehydratase